MRARPESGVGTGPLVARLAAGLRYAFARLGARLRGAGRLCQGVRASVVPTAVPVGAVAEGLQAAPITEMPTGPVPPTDRVRAASRARTHPAVTRRQRRGGALRRAGLAPWAPIWLALGIGIWFRLTNQPGLPLQAMIGLAGLGCGALFVRAASWADRGWMSFDLAGRIRLLGFALGLIAAGFSLAGMRAALVAAPVLEYRYYGPVEGRVIELDRSGRDRLRLTLDRVYLRNVAQRDRPRRVRLTLIGDAATGPPLMPGQHVMMTGHLGRPPGPSEPGGFDFRRFAWFQGLGAVGYTRGPVLTAAPPEQGLVMRLNRLRMATARGIHDRIGGQPGAVAAALMTGDRSFIEERSNEVMRRANLYHIISISGLHMGMLTGFVYAALRLLLVVVQAGGRALAWPMHKLAAIGALLAGAGYLWLSGASVATERAFIMVAVMLVAILADRRAISLRTVSLAALIILIRAPEALMSAGFQMSFAATVALILVFDHWARIAPHLPALIRPVAMLLLSSLVAGLATGPIAAAHFNRIAHYGILANLLVVPVMGIAVMPMGVIAALLVPLNLAGPALWIMGKGCAWMLAIGGWVSGLDGAVSAVPTPPALVLPVLAGGALLALLRWPDPRPPDPLAASATSGGWAPFLPAMLGCAAMILAVSLWLFSARPAVLIDAQGDAMAMMSVQGRVPSKPRGGRFAQDNWLRADGDLAQQAEAADRPGWRAEGRARIASWPEGGLRLVHLTGKGSADEIALYCQPDAVVVTNDTRAAGRAEGGCQLFTPKSLRESGAIALRPGRDGPEIDSVAALSGNRPWSR